VAKGDSVNRPLTKTELERIAISLKGVVRLLEDTAAQPEVWGEQTIAQVQDMVADAVVHELS
jgi:hypothetical protein